MTHEIACLLLDMARASYDVSLELINCALELTGDLS